MPPPAASQLWTRNPWTWIVCMKSKNPPWTCYNCNKPGHITQNCLEPHMHQVCNADPLSLETIQAIMEAIRIAVGGDAMRGEGSLATLSLQEVRQRSCRIFRPATSERCALVAS